MSESNKSATDLPPLKRYITTHLPDGRSVYTPFKAQSGWSHPGVGKVYRSYAVGSVPVVLKGDADIVAFESPNGAASGSKNDIVVKPNGANVAVVDLSPGGMSTMHQTVSIDFSICVVGTIDHELDSGEVVRLKPGDHIVQRGTMHKWINASQIEPARFIAVTLPCDPFPVGGKLLKEVHLPAKL